jgi:hypothetical protein
MKLYPHFPIDLRSFMLNQAPGQNYLSMVYQMSPGTVAERSKACTVFARSKAGIMGSNPTQDMDV